MGNFEVFRGCQQSVSLLSACVLAVGVALTPSLANADSDEVPLLSRAEVHAELRLLAAAEGISLDEPPAMYSPEPGANSPAVTAAAKILGLDIAKTYTGYVRKSYFGGGATVGGQVIVAALLADFPERYKLLFTLAHEHAHSELEHSSERLAEEYRVVAKRCPPCVAEAQPKLKALQNLTKEDARALRPILHRHELEADAWAVRRMIQAGVPVTSGEELFARIHTAEELEDPAQWDCDTHPPYHLRIRAVNAAIRELSSRGEAHRPN